MSEKLKSLLAKSFLKKSKDGKHMDGFIQGSSSSSSRRQVLMSVVQVESPRCVVAFME
jgi:hypothetical protein